MSYNSKYTGQQVEALLDIVSQGGGTGGEIQKTTEAEILAMGFTKNEGTITEVKMNGVSKGTSGVVDLGTVITEHQDISGKVDKVAGRQLSTEDFTTFLKTKLEGLSNYNDAEIQAAVLSLQTQLNTLVSGNANEAINSFNEIIAFLDGVKDSQDLSSIIASIEQQIAAKQDKITDLETIRSGAAKGATALQEHQDISGKQDRLVSGTNIKTINGNSILGSGNIVIEGGSGGTSDGVAYPYVDKTSDKSESFTIMPNTFYNFGVRDSLEILYGVLVHGEVTQEFVFQFESNAGGTTSLTFGDFQLRWAGDSPVIEPNTTYQVSILRNIAMWIGVKNHYAGGQ